MFLTAGRLVLVSRPNVSCVGLRQVSCWGVPRNSSKASQTSIGPVLQTLVHHMFDSKALLENLSAY